MLLGASNFKPDKGKVSAGIVEQEVESWEEVIREQDGWIRDAVSEGCVVEVEVGEVIRNEGLGFELFTPKMFSGPTMSYESTR